MSKPKPRTLGAFAHAICHLQDAASHVNMITSCLDADGVRYDHGAIAEIRDRVRACEMDLQAILDGLRNPLTNVGT